MVAFIYRRLLLIALTVFRYSSINAVLSFQLMERAIRTFLWILLFDIIINRIIRLYDSIIDSIINSIIIKVLLFLKD